MSTEMFQCDVCQRSYKTLTSLTRHARNHTEELSNMHSCDICGTSFARRDILSRHRASAHHDSARKARQRCHTACESCRAARTRCDGKQPCTSCAGNDRQCHYRHHGRRVSRPTRTTPSAQSSSTPQSVAQPTAATASPHPPLSPANTQDGLQDVPGIGGAPASHLDVLPSNDPLLEPYPILPEALGDWAVDLDGMSWPWLHETLFLNEDPYVTHISTPAPSQHQDCANDQIDALGATSLDATQDVAQLDLTATLSSEVDTLVHYATEAAMGLENNLENSQYWRQASSRLHITLGDYQPSPGRAQTQPDPQWHVLHQAIMTYYLPQFNKLWPMFPDNSELFPDNLHAVLYLVLVSIGSMYGSDTQKQFGMLLHRSLRRLLTASLFELERPETDLVWMAQARLLTQVQGLYFAQPQGFTYAQVGATATHKFGTTVLTSASISVPS